MLWKNFSSGLCGPPRQIFSLDCSAVSIWHLYSPAKCTKLPRFFLLDSQKPPVSPTKSLPCNFCTYPETWGSYSFVGEGMVLKITFSFSALTPLSDLKADGKKTVWRPEAICHFPFSSDKTWNTYTPKKMNRHRTWKNDGLVADDDFPNFPGCPGVFSGFQHVNLPGV